jgi:hypothetical protein
MRHHFRLLAALAVCLVAYGLLLVAFHLLSEPSDSAVLAGIVMIFALLVFVPLAVRTMWRRL